MSILRRIANLFRRSKLDEEIEAELRAHIEMRTADNIAAGMSPGEARRDALLRFGNRTALKERVTAADAQMFLDSLWRDLKFGARMMRKWPGFTATAVLTLALGIGANSAIFQLLDAVRLSRLPVTKPEELVDVHLAQGDGGCCSFDGRYPNLTYPLWEQLKQQQQAFSAIAAWGTDTFNLAAGGEARYAQGLWVSGSFFDTLGVGAVRGRTLSQVDDRSGSGCSTGVVVSYAFWQRELGGGGDVIGKAITLEGHPFQIVGVTPPSFFGLEVGREFDVAAPICAEPLIKGKDSDLEHRWGWWLAVIGRLKPGWTVERATAYLNSISPGLFQATEPTDLKVDGYLKDRLAAFPAASGLSTVREQYETPLTLLMAIVAVTLMIVCLNLGNLMLARATARGPEVAIRYSLGATRGRLMRQLLVESLVLAAVGALLGAAFAPAVSHLLVSFVTTSHTPLFVSVHLDLPFFLFVAALAGMTCVLTGLAPALRATKTGLSAAIRAEDRGLTTNRQRLGLQRALVVMQVTLSLVLLVGALLFVESFRNLARLDAGFRGQGVLVTDLDLTKLNIPAERRAEYTEELLKTVRAIPGVLRAAATRIVPMSGDGWTQYVLIDHSSMEGRRSSRFSSISPGYFQALGIPVLTGRDFDERDTATAPKVAIVNESFARSLLGGTSAVGKTFGLKVGNNGETIYEIVGVVGDTKYANLREPFAPIAYLAASQESNPKPTTHFLIRSNLPAGELMSDVKSVVGRENPEIGIDFYVFETRIRESIVRERLMATLSGFFGALAVLLATVGLYGAVAYAVTRRRKEIAIRMALGADRSCVMRMILGEAAVLVAIGLGCGSLFAMGAASAARALLFGLGPRDPATFAAGAAVLAAVTLAASYVPAWRAMRADPMVALRHE